MPRHSVSDPDRGRVVHIEVRLDWLIRFARLKKAGAHRRLNAVENLVSALTRPWREGLTLIADREIRLSAQTARALAEWVECRGAPAARDAERLLAITTGDVVDEAVPGGWIRVLLERMGR